MPQPTITSAVFLGNNPQPNGQGVMAWVNLADNASWFPQDYEIDGTNRQIGIAPLPFRGRGAYVSDDFGSKSIIIPSKYFEGPGVALGAAKAQLSQAGEQYLTLDGKVTGALVKLKSFGTPKRLRKFSPFWWDLPQLEFIMKEPFFQDLLPTGSLNGETLQSNFEAADPASTLAVLLRSIGTDATGLLLTSGGGAWTALVGAPTIAANVVTLPAGCLMKVGHAEWWDCMPHLRWQWATGGTFDVRVHLTDGNNWVRAYCDGINLVIQKMVAGVASGSLAQSAAALVNGTQYWIELRAQGTTYTAFLYADSAGAVGAPITNCSVVITDPALKTGAVAVGAAGATLHMGGAFASVFWVAGPAPAGWQPGTNNWTLGEAAFCWTKSTVFAGAGALSIYRASAGTDNAYWWAPAAVPAGTYVLTGQLRATGTANAYMQIDSAGISGSVADDSQWHPIVSAPLVNPGANIARCMFTTGVGTAYYDTFVASKQVSSVPGIPYYLQPGIEQVPLSGSVSPGTSTSWTFPYAGSVRTNLLFQLNIPNTNTVVINQLILANTMSGETLTITFGPPLAANTAWTITIDTAAFTVTDNLGNSHDISGSFPMLYGPAGQNNPITATVITASGTSTGVTLDSKWFSRWEA